MLGKNTIKKITKIQELLANKKEGTLVACHGAVDPQEMVFNAIVINNEGAFITNVHEHYDDSSYVVLVNVDNVYHIYLQKQVREKLL